MDRILYLQKQDEQFMDYEALCLRCGHCCGAGDGDPCINLARDCQDRYYCKAYQVRLGSQKTVSGKEFTCVAIRELLKRRALHPQCPYYK